MSEPYRIARIPKAHGKYREIFIPVDDFRKLLVDLLPELNRILTECQVLDVAYAFRKGRNCALMAKQHVGRPFVVSIDLENFFESIHAHHVEGLIGRDLIDYCFVDGRLPQGFPTSPTISNIAFCSVDAAIAEALNAIGVDVIYTRYADDLVFSFFDELRAKEIVNAVKDVVESRGFRVNNRKTRMQSLKGGRIVIVGIGVDQDGLHPTRSTRRKIRAALHQGNEVSASGLREWARCALPRDVSMEFRPQTEEKL